MILRSVLIALAAADIFFWIANHWRPVPINVLGLGDTAILKVSEEGWHWIGVSGPVVRHWHVFLVLAIAFGATYFGRRSDDAADAAGSFPVIGPKEK